jgi:hypothetical protein
MLIIEIGVLLSFSEVFQISKIESSNYYSPLFLKLGGKNLLKFDEVSFARELENEDPTIKKVIVKKMVPNTLVILFEKRRPLFVVTDREEADFFFADEEGKVFAKIGNSESFNLPILKTERISLKEGVILDNSNEKAAVSLFINANKLSLDFKELAVNGERLVMSKNEAKIIFDSGNFDNLKLEALQLLLKRFTIEGKKPKEINLRFDKPIIKF